MKISAKAMPLLLEFVGSAATSAVLYAALSRSGLQLLGAISVGFVFAGFLAVGLPKYFVQINPLVTIGLWMSRRLSSVNALFSLAAQALGALASWQLIEFILDRPLNSLAQAGFDKQIFAAEAAGAFVFAFIISQLINRKGVEENRLIFVAFASVSVGMIVASLSASSYGLINPFVAVGIQSWNVTFATAPLVGGIIGLSIVPLANYIDSRPSKKTANKKVTAKTTKKKTTKKKK